MLQGIIVKKVLDLVLKQLLKQFKLDKIQDYVEKPNELDKQMKQVQKNLNKCLKSNEDLEKEVAILKKDSHPVKEFVCLECGCKAKRKNKEK